MIRLIVVASFLLGVVALAQLEEDKEPYSNGIISIIEDLPEPTGEPRRSTPFIEVIDVDAATACLDEGFDSEACEDHEYSVPFIAKDMAEGVEEAIVDALYRLETRTKHRTNIETGQTPALFYCITGLGAIDLRHYFLKGELFFPADEFCDGKAAEVLPPCTFQCDLPLSTCPTPRQACVECAAEQVLEAKEHALAEYYPDYLEDVGEALAQNMTLALPWQGPLITPGGSLISPVTGLEPPYEPLVDMALEASQEDPRAVSYFFQASAYSLPCKATVPPQVVDLLYRLPGDEFDPEAPGLKPLERFKRHLADREDAYDTHTRFNYWWNGEDSIYPQYTAAGAGILGAAGEDSILAVGTPLLHACLGYAVIFQVSQEFNAYVRLPGFIRRATCLSSAFPFVAPTLTPPVPQTVEGFFFHTDWVSVPEGMDIPGVEGEPVY